MRGVFCQLEALEKCATRKDLEKVLESLPQTLDETYEQILRNIAPENQKYVTSAIHWIAFSIRPLHLIELATAATIDPHTDLPIHVDDHIPPEWLFEILSGLVIMTEYRRDPAVGFAHFSVQEYLISDRIPSDLIKFRTTEITAHSFIMESCLKFLPYYTSSGMEMLRDKLHEFHFQSRFLGHANITII